MLVFFRSLRHAQRPERLLLVLKRRIDTGEKVLIVSLVLGRSGRPAGRGQCLDLVQEHDPASVTLIDRKDAYAFLVRAFALAKVDVIASANDLASIDLTSFAEAVRTSLWRVFSSDVSLRPAIEEANNSL